MRFTSPLIPGTLVQRYKRFLADVRLDGGEVITAHCPNPGSMKTCDAPGWRVYLSRSDNPRRKLPYTLEMLHNGATWIGVHTGRPNGIVAEAIAAGRVPELAGYPTLRREVRYGENSRIDLLLEKKRRKPCYVEVKNVTMIDGAGCYLFPDAVTKRGQKHLRELMAMQAAGARAVSFFLIQRGDADRFRPADEIDPDFARTLRQAHAQGVEVLAYRADVSPEAITLARPVPCAL